MKTAAAMIPETSPTESAAMLGVKLLLQAILSLVVGRARCPHILHKHLAKALEDLQRGGAAVRRPWQATTACEWLQRDELTLLIQLPESVLYNGSRLKSEPSGTAKYRDVTVECLLISYRP
jgi:hypothetical protein